MKKLLVFVIVVAVIGVGGWFMYSRVLAPPPKRACLRLAELCSAVTERGDLEKCEQAFEKLESVAGEASIDNAASCINEAQSCAKAAGCVFGAGAGAMGEFLKGVEDALKKSK